MEQGIQKKTRLGLIVAVYLAGIFMGAIDTGIVTPARTIIQSALGANEQTGIWMITIYTLAYAASIPIMGKLADRFGRKYIYLISILLFGLGSLFCGLSESFGSFSVLLGARVIQAIGGGGIVPVATAEFGTSFPKEKRGMALGLVGGVYGIANILGASAGSAILDIFGTNNWSYIFYLNLPITAFILLAGFFALPNTREENVKKIDFAGISILTGMVLSLLYGLKNIDFFALGTSITSTAVYPFLIIFVLLLPLLIYVEKKAQDPVINLLYFKNPKIVITLILSFIVGIVMMGMIFVPQFSENALKIVSGKGGYFVVILGIFAGVGAPLSGKLIDKFGAKPILSFGFIITIIGCIFLIFVTIVNASMATVVISLILIGLGMGFTLGTPLNYMMLDNTDKREANSALATLSLVRSIGTVIGPAIMVAFIAHAGLNVQTNVMSILPSEVTVPATQTARTLTEELNALKQDAAMAEKLKDVDIPDFSKDQIIGIDMSDSSSTNMPAGLIESIQSSDVTNIVDRTKALAEGMFGQMTPDLIAEIQNGVQKGIDAITAGSGELDQAISGVEQGISSLEGLQQQIAGMPSQAFGQADLTAMIPEQVQSQIPDSALAQLAGIKTPSELQAKIDELKAQKTGLESAKQQMEDTVGNLNTLKSEVPSSFQEAQKTYLGQIEEKRAAIESTFQATLNEGFKNVYWTTAASALAALVLLMFYREKRKPGELQ